MQYYNYLTPWLQNSNPTTIGNMLIYFAPYLTYFVCGIYEVRDKVKIDNFFIAHNITNWRRSPLTPALEYVDLHGDELIKTLINFWETNKTLPGIEDYFIIRLFDPLAYLLKEPIPRDVRLDNNDLPKYLTPIY